MHPLYRRLLLGTAVALHLATGYFYLFVGLVAPGWAVAVLWTVWVVLLVVLVRTGTRHPPRALLVPAAALALLYGVLTAGDVFLGWTA